MFINNSMTKEVITITKETGIFEIKEKMNKYAIRHIPVVEKDGLLVGIVSDRDIRSALPINYFKSCMNNQDMQKYAEIKVKDIMTMDVVSVMPMDTIQDALLLIQNKKIGALPVVDEKGNLKGIISVRDLLRAFINVLGINQPGTLLGIIAEEKVGQLKKIVDAVTEENISFGSVLVARYFDKNKRAVFVYLLTLNVAKIKKKLTDMGFELIEPMNWYLDQLPKEA